MSKLPLSKARGLPVWALIAALLAGFAVPGAAHGANASLDAKKKALNDQIASLKKDLAGYDKTVGAAQDKRDAQKKEVEGAAADAKATLDAVAAAKTQNTEARAAEAAVISGLRKKSESDPGVAAAAAALKSAQEAFAAASDKATGPLKDSAAYKAAQAEVDTNTEAMKKLQETPDSDTPGERAKLAQAMVTSQKSLDALREEAINANPAARDARTKLTAAEADMAAANKKIDDANKNDPARTEAHGRVEETGKALKDAEASNAKSQTKLAAARNASRELERAYAKQKQQADMAKNAIENDQAALRALK